MHELTLAERAMEIVEAAARVTNAQRVTRITLAVGALAHVDTDSFHYCCGVVSRGTLIENAVIHIERHAGKAQCNDCNVSVRLERVGEPCPQCGGYNLAITDGDQLQVLDIGIE